MAYVGIDGKLYLQDDGTGGEWIEVKKAIDVGLNISQNAVAVGSRASRWQSYLPGLKDAELSCGYRVKRGTDPVLAILRSMCLSGQNLVYVAVMDDDIETVGSTGLAMWCMLSGENLGQGLEEGAQLEFTFKPAYVESDGAPVDPALLVIVE